MRILREELSQEFLKEYLHYCTVSGKFTYLKKTGKKAVIGANVGSVSKRDGHIEIRFMGTLYRANRLAWFYMTGVWPEYVDHQDHDELNNSWANLRNVSKQENNKNMPKKRTNISGVTGVWFSKQRSKWVAEIIDSGKKVHLGVFSDIDDAAFARKQAEALLKYHPNHGK